MKVILYMAMSVNGFIAQKNGDEDFLSDRNWKTFSQLAKKFGCFAAGRNTYEKVQKWKEFNFSNIDAKKIIVSSQKFSLQKGFTLAHSPEEAVALAKQLGYKNLLLVGGSNLNQSFIKANLIDEIILNVEPTLIGDGIRLFAKGKFEQQLQIKSIREIAEGIIQLQYIVKK